MYDVLLSVQERSLTLAVVAQGGGKIMRCLWLVTNVFQLRVHWVEIDVSYAWELILLFSVAVLSRESFIQILL